MGVEEQARLDAQTMKRIGERWSARPKRSPRRRWWESPTIRRHISKKVIPGGTESGFWHVEALKATGRTFPRALSVGCGNAYQEIDLLREGSWSISTFSSSLRR